MGNYAKAREALKARTTASLEEAMAETPEWVKGLYKQHLREIAYCRSVGAEARARYYRKCLRLLLAEYPGLGRQ